MHCGMNWICVFIGGGAGSLCRYLLSQLFTSPAGHWPWATWTANLAGCLLIGLLTGYIGRRSDAWWALLLVTGFCGGFTTFSTFSNETLTLWRSGQAAAALTYALTSGTGGLACAAAGFACTHRMAGA